MMDPDDPAASERNVRHLALRGGVVTAVLSVTPIGVGAAYGLPGEAQSCYLVTGRDVAICLDLGAGALNGLQRHVAPETLDAIVISHLHADHCVDLFSLRIYMNYGPGRGRRLRLIGPPELRARLAAFAGDEGWDDAFAFETIEPSAGDVAVGTARLRFALVPHGDGAFAVRVDQDGAAIAYGADCAPNDALPELASGVAILIAEAGSGVDVEPNAIHLRGVDAGAIARRAGAARLLLTHCYPEHDRDATLAEARAAFAGPVEWARQGVTVRTA